MVFSRSACSGIRKRATIPRSSARWSRRLADNRQVLGPVRTAICGVPDGRRFVRILVEAEYDPVGCAEEQHLVRVATGTAQRRLHDMPVPAAVGGGLE